MLELLGVVLGALAVIFGFAAAVVAFWTGRTPAIIDDQAVDSLALDAGLTAARNRAL